MDGLAARLLHDRASGPPQGQSACHDFPVGSHLDHSRITQEVGRVRHVAVRRVAADPFPAVRQPAQVGQRPVETDSAGVLNGLACAGLVSDRAYPAYSGGDVGWLGAGPARQECLEKPGWLVKMSSRTSSTRPSLTRTYIEPSPSTLASPLACRCDHRDGSFPGRRSRPAGLLWSAHVVASRIRVRAPSMSWPGTKGSSPVTPMPLVSLTSHRDTGSGYSRAASSGPNRRSEGDAWNYGRRGRLATRPACA